MYCFFFLLFICIGILSLKKKKSQKISDLVLMKNFVAFKNITHTNYFQYSLPPFHTHPALMLGERWCGWHEINKSSYSCLVLEIQELKH